MQTHRFLNFLKTKGSQALKIHTVFLKSQSEDDTDIAKKENAKDN